MTRTRLSQRITKITSDYIEAIETFSNGDIEVALYYRKDSPLIN